jgi:hypothetical protein
VIGDSHKLGIINRFHRTLKNKMLKMFIAQNSVRWIDSLDKLIKNYNNTPNRMTGFTPNEASNKFIQNILINDAQEITDKFDEKSDDINIGDFCRIEIKKKTFDKDKETYSRQVFKIIGITKNSVILDNEMKVKKTEIQIVKNYKPDENVNEIHQAKVKSRIRRRLKKEGI